MEVICPKCLRTSDVRLEKGERLRYFNCVWCGGARVFPRTVKVEASLREQRRGGGLGPLFAHRPAPPSVQSPITSTRRGNHEQ